MNPEEKTSFEPREPPAPVWLRKTTEQNIQLEQNTFVKPRGLRQNTEEDNQSWDDTSFELKVPSYPLWVRQNTEEEEDDDEDEEGAGITMPGHPLNKVIPIK